MRRLVLAFVLATAAPHLLGAQTIRGSVVDDSTRLPVADVSITLIDAAGTEAVRGIRSDSLGVFVIHAGQPGLWRVRAARIGYSPVTSDPIQLGVGQLAIIRLQMSTVAQRLAPVRVVDRRRLSAAELMSPTGFDLRESRGTGSFLSGAALAEHADEDARELLVTRFRNVLFPGDGLDGPIVLMRRGTTGCSPEIHLDGVVLSSGLPDDTLAGRRERALATLGGHRASALHGIEVYRANEVPAPSIGGFLGMDQRSRSVGGPRACGVIAVWTKHGVTRTLAMRRGAGRTGVQVIQGTVVDLDSAEPVANVPVTLHSEANEVLDDPVVSDSAGRFTIRTRRTGRIRLQTASIGFTPSITTPFPIVPEELIILRILVSARRPVLVPLGIAARAVPETYAATSLGGFAYRREHGVVGTFFGADDIGRRGGVTLAELVREVVGVFVDGVAGAERITMRSSLPGAEARCAPGVLVDGRRTAAADSVGRTRLSPNVFGIEVFRSPSETPAAFADSGPDDCGLIGIWMRPG